VKDEEPILGPLQNAMNLTRNIVIATVLASCVFAPPARSADDSKNMEDLVAAAERGDADAQYRFARALQTGDGVKADLGKALEWMKKAAAQEHVEALAMLGYWHSVGLGVKKDEAEARRFFEKAAAKGSAAAKGNLGLFMIQGRGGEKDIARGLGLMQAAVDEGNMQSAAMLGEIYYFGTHADGKPDYQKAHDTLLKPADAGNAGAQNMLGVIFKDGRLGKKDEDSARIWLEKAALRGNGKACFNLAELWNYRSPDRWARIEALRWLLVGQGLDEVAAYYFLEDIKKNLAPDELKAAEKLAEITRSTLPRRK
jgi:uncharacterized protein